jgi:hypothetical protein
MLEGSRVAVPLCKVVWVAWMASARMDAPQSIADAVNATRTRTVGQRRMKLNSSSAPSSGQSRIALAVSVRARSSPSRGQAKGKSHAPWSIAIVQTSDVTTTNQPTVMLFRSTPGPAGRE